MRGNYDEENDNDVYEKSDECCGGSAICTQDINFKGKTGKQIGRKKCPAPNILADLQFVDDPGEIQNVLNQVDDNGITKTAEFIFSLRPFLKDGGKMLLEFSQQDLADFRTLVDNIVDYRVQDEGDVMHVTQNIMKEKFDHLTMYMKDRTVKIMEKLHTISSKFDWKNDGKDRAKLSPLITINTTKKVPGKSVDVTKNLIHQIFIRNQWLKAELHRLQEENSQLEDFLKGFKLLALQRKNEEINVPRMLVNEQKILQTRLEKLKKIYHKNIEKIHELYVNHEAYNKDT